MFLISLPLSLIDTDIFMFLCDLTFDRVDVLSDGACLGPHRTQLVRNSVHVAFDAVRN